MALDATALAALIKSEVGTANAEFPDKIGDGLDWLFDAVAAAVVAHVQSSAVVTVTGTTASSCTAGGSAGTCSGSGTIA